MGAIVAVMIGRIIHSKLGIVITIVLGSVGAVEFAFIISFFGFAYGLAGIIIGSLIGPIVLTALARLFTSANSQTL